MKRADLLAPLLRDVFQHTPVHLVAGERSRPGWTVPAWALTAAASYTEIPQSGHMVMLEAPEAFGNTLMKLVDNRDIHQHPRSIA